MFAMIPASAVPIGPLQASSAQDGIISAVSETVVLGWSTTTTTTTSANNSLAATITTTRLKWMKL
jgi:hypothetical protein